MKRPHNNEYQFQEFLCLKKSDPLHKQLINKLRKEGYFCTGSIIRVQKKQSKVGKENETYQFLPCTYCKVKSILVQFYTTNLNCKIFAVRKKNIKVVFTVICIVYFH